MLQLFLVPGRNQEELEYSVDWCGAASNSRNGTSESRNEP